MDCNRKLKTCSSILYNNYRVYHQRFFAHVTYSRIRRHIRWPLNQISVGACMRLVSQPGGQLKIVSNNLQHISHSLDNINRGARCSAVECRTRNHVGVIPDRREPYRRVPLGRVHLDEHVSPGSNPPLLPFRRLGIFVLSIDFPKKASWCRNVRQGKKCKAAVQRTGYCAI